MPAMIQEVRVFVAYVGTDVHRAMFAGHDRSDDVSRRWMFGERVGQQCPLETKKRITDGGSLRERVDVSMGRRGAASAYK